VRVAVIGGTGLTGRHVVDALTRAGHEPVVVARSTGVDVLTGTGLADALAGADSVVDVLNMRAADFGTATERLLAAEQQAGVEHHVLLSIFGLDRVEGGDYYAGKRLQEELVLNGPVPATVLRAAQFFEFAGMMVEWTRQGDIALVPPVLLQPVAVGDVGEVIAELATTDAIEGVVEVAGPEPQDLFDMARRTLGAGGEKIRLVPSWRGPFGPEFAGEVLVPGPDTRLATATFDQWLETQR
jgi:uncharacterized protein YbjT (DUF2867 family)